MSASGSSCGRSNMPSVPFGTLRLMPSSIMFQVGLAFFIACLCTRIYVSLERSAPTLKVRLQSCPILISVAMTLVI